MSYTARVFGMLAMFFLFGQLQRFSREKSSWEILADLLGLMRPLETIRLFDLQYFLEEDYVLEVTDTSHTCAEAGARKVVIRLDQREVIYLCSSNPRGPVETMQLMMTGMRPMRLTFLDGILIELERWNPHTLQTHFDYFAGDRRSLAAFREQVVKLISTALPVL